MSPLSNKLEALADLHCVDVLWLQEFWLKRAAIREYDGGMSRREAEQAALRDVDDELSHRVTATQAEATASRSANSERKNARTTTTKKSTRTP